MSSLCSIFDVIQEFHDQNDQKTQEHQKTIKKHSLPFHETLSSLPTTNQENQQKGSESEDQSGDQDHSQPLLRKNRAKKITKDSKWTPQDEKKYWKFFIHYKIACPVNKVSWKKWKCESIYKEMGKFVNKTSKQCKSKDQNMKKKYLDKEGRHDVLDIAIMKLQSFSEKDEEIASLITTYSQIGEKGSYHMRLLDEKMQKIQESEFRFNFLLGMFENSQDEKDVMGNEMFL